MHKKGTVSRIVAISMMLIAFGTIILVHELGHFVACKIFNIKTPLFSIGFGPAVIKKRIQQTIFQISLLPLGGYVSIDMHDLQQKSYWQKMIVIIAGFFNNILLSMFLLFFLSKLNKTKAINSIESLDPASSAEQNDLKKEDRIIAINDNQTISPKTIIESIIASGNKELTIIIEREGTLLEKKITVPIMIWMGMPIGYLGINFKTINTQKSFLEEIKETYQTTYALAYEYILLLANLFSPLSIQTIKKPLADIALANQYYKRGYQLFLFFMAIISIQVGIFNILPIPLLDGGQIFIYSAQALSNYHLSLPQATMLLYGLFIAFLVKIMFTKHKK